MKPISSLIRRPDGLRIFECRFVNVKTRDGKKLTTENRLKRLHPYGCQRTQTKKQRQMLKTWHKLGKATLSRRTYSMLLSMCAETTAAPVRNHLPIPRLSLTPTDIRPWLCDPAAIANLFTQLRAFDHLKLCAKDGEVLDPWFIARSGERIPLGSTDIAAIVWERAACFTGKVTLTELQEIGDAYLACHADNEASAMAEIILGHTKGQTAANWIHFWLRVPKKDRLSELKHWMHNYAEALECARQLVDLAESACACRAKDYRGLHYLWKGILAGSCPQQLADGLYLWQHYGWNYAPSVFPEGTIDLDILQRLTKRMSDQENWSWVAARTWYAMHTHPVLQESFAAILDEPRGHRSHLLDLVREVRYGSRDDELARQFNRDFKEVSLCLQNMPEAYREKAVSYFEYVYWDRSTKLSAGKLMRHIATLCAKPFTESETASLWCKLLCDWGGYHLPLSSWKRIDGSSRSNNQREAIEQGLDRWDKDGLRSIVQRGLKVRVRLTLEILRLTRQSIITEVDAGFAKLREHPLFDLSLEKITDLDTFAYLLGTSKELEKWREHISGKRTLRAESAQNIGDMLEGRRTEALLLYFKNELAQPSENSDELQLHTRLYASAADENSRVYRKLIQRYRTAGEQGILSHPRNQHWLKTHPFVRKGIWLTGVRAEIKLPDGKHVFLEMERRFEQVLKMGTLVNSCLALDGCYSHSALANAADVNKQVVMAYDADQRFLARQLIGISEQRELVVFDVYGQESKRLMPAFAAFDFQLGHLLALPIHGEGEYDIQRIVCREWYDDISWQPMKDPEATIVGRQWGGGIIGAR